MSVIPAGSSARIFGCSPWFDAIFCAIGFSVVVAVVVVDVVEACDVAAVVDVRLVEREPLGAGAVVLAEFPCVVATVGGFALPWAVGAEMTGREVGATGACAFGEGGFGPAFAEAAATDSIAATSTILDTRMVILRT